MIARRRLSLAWLLMPLAFVGGFTLTAYPIAVAAPPLAGLPPDNFTREYVTALVEQVLQSMALPSDPPADAAAAMARAHVLESARSDNAKKMEALLNQWAGYDVSADRSSMKAMNARYDFYNAVEQRRVAVSRGAPLPVDPIMTTAVSLLQNMTDQRIQIGRLIVFAAQKGDPEAQFLAGSANAGGILVIPLGDLGARLPDRVGFQKFWQNYWLTKAAQRGWTAAQLALGRSEAMNSILPYMGADKRDIFVHEILEDCPDFPPAPAGATTQTILGDPEYSTAVRQWSAACRARGREWLTKAVISHDPAAELALAQAYENEAKATFGGANLPQAAPLSQQAFTWYRKAVLDGSREAAERLMQVYEAGDEGINGMNGIAGVHKDLQAAAAMAKIALDLTPKDWDRKELEVKFAELTKQAKQQAQLDHDAAETFLKLAAAFRQAGEEATRQRAEWQRKPVAYRHNACVSECSSRHNSCVSSNNSNAMWAHLGAAGGSPMVAGMAAGAIRNCGVSDSMCMSNCMDGGP